MSEEISDYDKLILDPEEQTAVTPPDDKSAVVEPPAENTSQVDPKVEEAGEKTPSGFEGFDGIATPDGKRVIPFSHLDEKNKQLAEANQKYQNLVNQIEEFKKGQGVTTPVISQEALDKLAELREYDEEGANLFEKTLQDLAAAAQRAAQLEQAELAKQQQTAAQAEAQQQAIIESYPNLKAIQQNPEQWEQAGKVYESFYKNPATAQLSESEKIARLNDAMTVLLGLPNQAQTQNTAPKAVQPPAPTPQPAQIFSLSDIGSGYVAQENTAQKSIDDMSQFEIQALINKADYHDLPNLFN